MRYAVKQGNEIIRVFKSKINAEMYVENQDTASDLSIVETTEPLTDWPADSYYAGW